MAEPEVLGRKGYKKELRRLQVELVRLQEWIVHEGLKVVVLFEGRDTAGKGGTIRRITEKTNPRVIHDVALGKPSDRERTQWYFQRFSGWSRRAWKRRSCSSSETESQYLIKMIPERWMIRSKRGQECMNSSYSSFVQKPITRSTPARLYQERSKRTISPAAGNRAT